MAKGWNVADLRPGRDGYSDWNFGDGREYYPIAGAPGLGRWFHVLLSLGQGITPRTLPDELKAELRFHPFSLAPPEGLKQTTYVAALATEAFFERLADSDSHRKAIPQAILGLPFGFPPDFADQPCSTGKPTPMPLPKRDPVDGMVVIGIIDDGIAFGHERFRTANHGARVEYAWVQDGECCDKVGACESGKSPVSYGREFRKFGTTEEGGIDALLEECRTGGSVDEEQFYRRVGLTDHARPGHKAVARQSAHGTKVMDLACGYDLKEDRQDRPIVCVQLSALSSADTSGASLEPNVLDAIWYILDRADRIACSHGVKHLPVVINFSYGMIAGPHDGTAPLEAAIDQIIERRRAATGKPHDIVLPSGNSHLSRCHAQVSFSDKEPTRALKWHVLPDDRTSSFMEIWLPYSESAPTSSRIKVSITPPWGDQSTFLEEANTKTGETNSGEGFSWIPFNGKPALCKISYEYVEAPTNRGRFIIALPPSTFHENPNRNELAPPGIWTITLTNQLLGSEEIVEAWIQRGDTPFSFFRRGRQSFFDEPCYVRFDAITGAEIEDDDHEAQGPCHIKRAGLISPIATGNRTVVMGGYVGKEMKATKYSAGGPVTPKRDAGQVNRDGPDAVTVSDDSWVHRGVLAAGTRSGSVVTFTGTSAAAPQITRFLANEIAGYVTSKTPYPGGREVVQQAACMPSGGKPQRVGHGYITQNQIPNWPAHLPRYWK